MLDSSQIEAVFRQLGFSQEKANKRIHGLVHPKSDLRVYVKTTAKGDPATKDPLVIHPDFDADRDQLEGLGLQPGGLYHSSNMSAFPRRQNKGATLIHAGLAVSVPSEKALRGLIDYLKGGEGSGDAVSDLQRAEPEIAELDATTKQQVIDARRGQGAFRAGLEDAWDGCCAVTRTANPFLLRASHIKPWRDSDNRERLDPNNGLLLLATLDAAFDTGLISFDDAGLVLISGELAGSDAAVAGIDSTLHLTRAPSDEQKGYLKHHRNHVFRD